MAGMIKRIKEKAREVVRGAALKLAQKLEGKKQEPPGQKKNEALVRRDPGLDCPRCAFRIKVSMDMLLNEGGATCPACGLKLTVDRERSQACLGALQKVHEAVQNAEEAGRGI